MANIVLYQTGNKSLDPKTKTYYDPWESHIWTCIKQIRRWNAKIPVYVITDRHDVFGENNFELLSVKRVFIDELNPDFDIQNSTYFLGDINPSARACGIRPFYIQSLMEKYNLTDVFTFDNDVMIYCDPEDVAKNARAVYRGVAVTPYSDNHMVMGMCYIKDHETMKNLNVHLWELMNSERGRWLLDMDLFSIVAKENQQEVIQNLPIWPDKKFSDYRHILGGIFDPCSIGQFLGGCDNGSPPGVLFGHHYISQRILEKKWRFFKSMDGQGRTIWFVQDVQSGENVRIFCLHIHTKKLKDFV